MDNLYRVCKLSVVLMKEEEIEQLPITHPWSALKGFLAGSIIAGAILYPFGFFRIVLFFIGFFVFLDTVFPAGVTMYGVTTLLFSIIGGLITFAFWLWKDPGYFLAIVFIAIIVLYYPRIKKLARR